jgi:hypothetical protein
MALIGLIIIAVAQMAFLVPGVPGIRWKLPAPMPPPGRTWERPDTGAVTS